MSNNFYTQSKKCSLKNLILAFKNPYYFFLINHFQAEISYSWPHPLNPSNYHTPSSHSAVHSFCQVEVVENLKEMEGKDHHPQLHFLSSIVELYQKTQCSHCSFLSISLSFPSINLYFDIISVIFFQFLQVSPKLEVNCSQYYAQQLGKIAV